MASSSKASGEIRRLTTCTNGGPLFLDVQDGRIVRMTPIEFDDSDAASWSIDARGRTFSPPLDRIDFAANFAHVAADSGAFVPLKRKPSEYLRENMWVSTSCNYLPGAFACSWNDLGKEHVVFASDYPYGKMDECLGFLEGRGLSDGDKEMLYEKNAAALGVSL